MEYNWVRQVFINKHIPFFSDRRGTYKSDTVLFSPSISFTEKQVLRHRFTASLQIVAVNVPLLLQDLKLKIKYFHSLSGAMKDLHCPTIHLSSPPFAQSIDLLFRVSFTFLPLHLSFFSPLIFSLCPLPLSPLIFSLRLLHLPLASLLFLAFHLFLSLPSSSLS